MGGLVFHVPLAILMGIAVFLLMRKKGWLRNVVSAALTLYLISELLLLLNYATDRKYNTIICPIGNSLHILAIPLLGYVYLKEQSLEKKKADESLLAYQNHLEDLVDERTAELTVVNNQLKQEVFDRTQAEKTLERVTHRYELVLESTGEGICGIDRQGTVSFANQAAAQMLGYTAAELTNKPSYSIWHRIQSEEVSFPAPFRRQPGKTRMKPDKQAKRCAWVRWFLFSEGLILLLALAGPGARKTTREAGDHALLARFFIENPSYLEAVIVNFVAVNLFVAVALLAAWLVVRLRR